jgi:hypothetical protein
MGCLWALAQRCTCTAITSSATQPWGFMMIETYSHNELLEAYLAWVNIPQEMTDLRLSAWDAYVDVRDGLPRGTTAQRRKLDEPTGDARVIWMDLDG